MAGPTGSAETPEHAPLTLAGVCARPEWADVTVVAGGRHLNRRLSTVVVAADLDTARPVRGALVAVLAPVTGADWRIDAALRRLADAGAAGLLVARMTTALRGTVALAERLAMPLLSADGDEGGAAAEERGESGAALASDPADTGGSGAPADGVLGLAVGLRELLAAPDLERARHVELAHEVLGRRQATPEVIVRTVTSLLGTRAWVLTGEGATVAGDPVKVPGFRATSAIEQRHPEGSGVVLLAPVLSSDARRADLWAGTRISVPEESWERTVLAVLAVAATALRSWRAERRVETERDARLRATVLGELLRTEGEPTVELRSRASELGWRLGGWHLGFHIGVPDGVDILGSTAELLSALATEGVHAEAVEQHDGWSGWVTLEHEPTPETVNDVVGAIRRTQRRLARLASSHVGVGRAHPDAAGIAATLGEAADAARLAVNRREVGRFLHIDRLGLAQLLLAWTRTDTFQPAARDLLAPLSEQPGELDRTLAAYLDAESNLTETAAVLGVHRNTVAGRVARIESLLGVDLSNADERLALHLACRTILGNGS